jgi:N-methylhydantoinase B
LRRSSGEIEILQSKCTVEMRRSDALIIMTPGGGGFGDPLKRPVERVLADVANGLVSSASAEADYGVVIDPDTLQVKALKRP